MPPFTFSANPTDEQLRKSPRGFLVIPTDGLPLTTASALTAFIRERVPA